MPNEDDAIADDFAASWDFLEQFYASLPANWNGHVMLTFIKQLRQAGYDRILRAGQAMTTFILSRSRRHGLRAGQSCIRIDPSDSGFKLVFYDGHKLEATITRDTNLTPEVESLLQRLAAYPID